MNEDNYPDPYKDCRPLQKEEKPKCPTEYEAQNKKKSESRKKS